VAGIVATATATCNRHTQIPKAPPVVFSYALSKANHVLCVTHPTKTPTNRVQQLKQFNWSQKSSAYLFFQ